MWYLLGLVSAGSKHCGEGQPGLYTRWEVHQYSRTPVHQDRELLALDKENHQHGINMCGSFKLRLNKETGKILNSAYFALNGSD